MDNLVAMSVNKGCCGQPATAALSPEGTQDGKAPAGAPGAEVQITGLASVSPHSTSSLTQTSTKLLNLTCPVFLN